MRRSPWIKVGVFCLVVIGLGLGLKALGIDVTQITPERVRQFVLSFGAFAPIAYVVAYGQPIVPLPALVLTIAAGLAFGPLWGTIVALVGAMIRACGQFLIAKRLGREAVERLLKGKLTQFDRQLGDNGFKAVLLVRLIPNFPFDIQNYGLGFSRIRFGAFALATLIGMIPWTIPLVYFGYSLTDMRQVWKLVGAMLILTGLVVAQRTWQAKHRQTSSTGTAHASPRAGSARNPD